MTVKLGFALVAVLWIVALAPVIRGLVRFIRTTRMADLQPTVVRRTGKPSEFDPALWRPVSPWVWEKRT